MAKVKNYNVYGSVEFINALRDEYEWLGRACKIESPGHLVVLALPEKKVIKKRDEKRRSGNRGTGSVRKEAS